MVNVVDTTQELTITLITEGIGTIVSFTADPMTAHPGDTVTLAYTLRNDGASADGLFGRIIDVGTATELDLQNFPSVAVAGTVNGGMQIIMPGNDITLRLEAGHVE